MIKKALVWDPYLDTLGGGERYSLTVAESLSQMGAEVTVPWSNQEILNQGRERFGLELKSVSADAALYQFLTKPHSWWQRYLRLRQFEVIFWVSDGSVPLLFGKKNLLHYQVPFRRINGSFISNQAKLLTINKIVVNSKFTQKVISKTLPNLKSRVLYPPVDVDHFTPDNKTNTILNVGRFVSPSHPKRQDVLIDAFAQLTKEHPKETADWKLILAGGHRGDEHELNLLRQQAEGLRVEIVVNPDSQTLKKLYGAASIYWHAAGYGIDEKQEPEKVEHFGITTVEAMAAGAVPIVINKGGQKEIVADDSGFVFSDIDQLVALTNKLVVNLDKRNLMAKMAVIRAKAFSLDMFQQKLLDLLK
jgi:glycosyltransferase involved in cell wall biosynthesis